MTWKLLSVNTSPSTATATLNSMTAKSELFHSNEPRSINTSAITAFAKKKLSRMSGAGAQAFEMVRGACLARVYTYAHTHAYAHRQADQAQCEPDREPSAMGTHGPLWLR